MWVAPAFGVFLEAGFDLLGTAPRDDGVDESIALRSLMSSSVNPMRFHAFT